MLNNNNNLINTDNLNIIKVFYNRVSLGSSLCSISICYEFNNNKGKYYILNIIPNTFIYINTLWQNNEFDKAKEYLNYECGVSNCEETKNTDTKMIYFYKTNLKYKIEIMPLECFNCFGIKEGKQCYDKKIRSLIKLQKILKEDKYDLVIENNIQAIKYLDYIKENFECYITILIYNIIFNFYQLLTKDKINTNIKEKLIEFITFLKAKDNTFNNLFKNYFNKNNFNIDDLINNKGMLYIYKDLPFLAIPGNLYIENPTDKNLNI